MDQQRQPATSIKRPTKDVRAWMRISQGDKDKLQRVADQYCLTPSQYLRIVLMKALKDELVISPKNI